VAEDVRPWCRSGRTPLPSLSRCGLAAPVTARPHPRFRNPVINGHDTSTIIHACADVTFPCSQNASRAAGSGTHNLMIRTVQYEGWNSLYRRRIGRVTTTARAENRTTRPRAATFSGPSKRATLTGLSGQGRPSLPFHGCGTHAGSRTTSGLVPPRPRSVAESTLYWSALQRRSLRRHPIKLERYRED
jgi:hypothetical protein